MIFARGRFNAETFKAKEDDECEDYERRDEDAQTQEAENAAAGDAE